MSGHRNNRQNPKRKKATTNKSRSETSELLADPGAGGKHIEVFIIAALFAFGVYHSVLYFGHQVVPNSDFPGFVRVARQILSFQAPSSYKRAPVVGLLQVCLSPFVAGQHPDLTAGWLLNAILHPFNVVLLWLIGKRIVGQSALWMAAIATVNPWVIQLLGEPIAETTLLFFMLLTFYFIFRRSKWSYLFASIMTMIRYEGAALIFAAFVMDMVYSESKRERVWSFVYSFIASIPLMLWVLGTFLSWHSQGSTHYLKEMGATSGGKIVWFEYVSLIWRTGFYQLLMPYPKASKDIIQMLANLSKMLVAAGFIFAVICGVFKRRWDVLALLIFLFLYIFVHAVHGFVIPRYCMPIYWIVLLLCVYGLRSGWQLINKGGRVPNAITAAFQGILLVMAFIWLMLLVPYLPRIAPMSLRSTSMPYVAMGLVAAILIVRRFFYRMRYFWRDLSVSMLVCLVMVSNQFLLVRVVGNGQRDIEFKLLADWYIANAEPGENILTTMPGSFRIFAPEHKDSVFGTGSIEAENSSDFVRKCYDKNIIYVAWDSRVGLNVGGRYYKLWGVKNTAMLAEARSVGPYEFITAIRANKRRFINVFRLRRDAAML